MGGKDKKKETEKDTESATKFLNSNCDCTMVAIAIKKPRVHEMSITHT